MARDATLSERDSVRTTTLDNLFLRLMLPDIEVWQDLIANEIPARSPLTAASVVTFNAGQSFGDGGTTIRIPHLDSLDTVTNPEPQHVTGDDGNALEVSRASGYSELAPVNLWGDAMYTDWPEVVNLGFDPRDKYEPQIAAKVSTYFDYFISYILKAVFDESAGCLADTHLDQARSEHLSLQLINRGKARQSRFVEGAGDGLNVIVVHSDVQAQASNDLFISTSPAPAGALVFENGLIPKIGTTIVIPNNVICAPQTDSGGNTYYPSYLCGANVLYAGYKKALQIWRDEVPLQNARQYLLSWAGASAVGMYGVSWAAGSIQNPTKTQRETATNWEKVGPNHEIRIRRIETSCDQL